MCQKALEDRKEQLNNLREEEENHSSWHGILPVGLTSEGGVAWAAGYDMGVLGSSGCWNIG